MAYLNIKRKWREQPQYTVEIDPAWRGKIAFASITGVADGRDVISKQPPVISGVSRRGTPRGLASYTSSGTNGLVWSGLTPVSNTGNGMAFLMLANPAASGTQGRALFLGNEAASFFNQCDLIFNSDKTGTSSSGIFAVTEYDNFFGASAQSSAGTMDGNWHVFIANRPAGDSTWALYRDGINVTDTTTFGTGIAMTAGVRVHCAPATTAGYTGNAVLAAVLTSLNRSEIADLSNNPWILFQARTRKIWIAASSSSGAGSASGLSAVTGVGASTASSVGSSSGLAATSGTGASTAASVGSSSGSASVSGVGTSSTGSSGSSTGISTVSGVGSSTADSVGSSSGVASASGVGASVAASVGSSDGVATVSGVGDSSIPGSSVGSASGSSSVSGVGASVAASVGSASGSSSAVAVSDNGSQSQGGDDFPGIVIEKRRKKTLAEQPNLHLQSIIDKAAREVLPATPKQAPTKTLSLKKPVLVATPEPEAGNPVTAINQEVIAAEAEKVAALLAQYHEQVKRMETEEDEELLLLIMGAF